jgi:Ca2+-binding RTX toxin-like protein
MALPVVEFLYGFPSFDPSNYFFDALFDGTFGTSTETKIVLAAPDGSRIVFKGEFTVDGLGVVTGGTVAAYNVFAGHTKVMKGNGFDIDAVDLIEAVAQWQMANQEPLNSLLLDLPTRYLGSELGDFVFGIDGAGSVFNGRQGDDELFAGSPDVTLKGGKDNDLLLAWEGLCRYSGGQGQDVFVFIDPAAPNKIADFSPEDDLFALSMDSFVGVGPGLLDDSQFKIGKQASTPEQIILHQRGKGNVFFDRDGSESVYEPVKFAKVAKGLDLDAHNFSGSDYSIMNPF